MAAFLWTLNTFLQKIPWTIFPNSFPSTTQLSLQYNNLHLKCILMDFSCMSAPILGIRNPKSKISFNNVFITYTHFFLIVVIFVFRSIHSLCFHFSPNIQIVYIFHLLFLHGPLFTALTFLLVSNTIRYVLFKFCVVFH